MTPAALAIAISLLTLGAFLFSAASTAGMIRLAPRIGLVDKPGHRKIHHVPKPLGGGVGIFLGVALPMLVGIVFFGTQDRHMTATINQGFPDESEKGLGPWPVIGNLIPDAYWSGIQDQV